MIRRCCILLILAISSGGALAHAQMPAAGPDPAKVKVRLGPLWMNPAVSLTNLGVDDNVFNEPDEALPKRDFTLTITPLTDLWLRAGRTWIKGSLREDIVWYQKYASERSANNSYTLGWQVPLDRLAFNVSNTWLKTHERPGFEIDARLLRKETTSTFLVEVRALSRTFVGVHGQRSNVNFDEAAVFLGNNLHDELNRVVTTGGLTLRQQLTPLTSINFTADRSQDRFKFNPIRDSDSTSLGASVAFDPAALIKGSASFGYRDFRPLAPDVPGYQGATVDVAISYSFFGTTKATLGAKRDVQYSFEVDQPYYLLTGFDASLAQQLFGPLDIVGRIGKQHLNYRDRLSSRIDVANRLDIVDTYGGGIGYHMGRDIRIGFNIDKQRRSSDLASRRYHGLKIGTAVTYGS